MRIQRKFKTLGQRQVLETRAGVIGPNARSRRLLVIHTKKSLRLARIGKVRHQAGAAADAAAQRVTQLTAELAQHATLITPAAHGLADLRVHAPELGRSVLEGTADL